MSRFKTKLVPAVTLAVAFLFSVALMRAVEPTVSNWQAAAGAPLSDAQIAAYLSISGKAPTGLLLLDSSQLLSNALKDMNAGMNQNNSTLQSQRDNHSGFSVMLFEPKAWLGKRKANATKKFLSYNAGDVAAEDKLPILRVAVAADMPEYINGDPGNGVDHVVLRSTDKTIVVQPLTIRQISQEAQNSYGAKEFRNGAEAIFSIADLEKVRKADQNREFLVTVVGEKRVRGKSFDKDFRVKRKHFEQLGDE